jgi:hypothetical protein
MILSEQTPAPLADETASDADGASLDTQLQEITAERDRHAADKLELIAKASALSKELEGARAQLATVSAERDDLRRKRDAAIAERDAIAAERDAAAAARDGAMAERDRLAAEATQAAAENARLGAQITNAGKPDPLVVFTDLLAEKTKALLAWIRSKIPENSPALARFDRAVEMATKAGCIAIKTIREVTVWLAPRLAAAYAWAKPRVLDLIAKAKGGDKTANPG